jgi:GTP cyclohydrolase I
VNNGNGNHEKTGGMDEFVLSGWEKKNNLLHLPPVMLETTGDRLEKIVRLLLQELGLDVNDQHFRDTPRRVARYYREFTQGQRARPEDILKTFQSTSSALITVSSIDFYSLCPHHLLPYGGKIHFCYVPNGRIVGISKIPRLVHALAARPVVQEDLVENIADAFMNVVNPLGCAVKAIAKHDCVAARGVKCPSAAMTTKAMRGIFQEKQFLCLQFEEAVAEGGTCVR